MAEEVLPLVKPVEAIAWFKAKGWQIGFDWRDVWQEEHARAFTVAKAMSRDLLEDIRAAVTRAIDEGTTLDQFSKELRPRLVARGWWGRKLMKDPATGVEKVVQLGSPARLRTIYQVNLRSSYMAGRWQRIQRSKKLFPFLRYVSVMDGRERPEHHDWHGTVLPVDDPWWDTHYPPCGWNCRCDAQPLNQRMLDRRGWAVNTPPRFPEKDYVNKRTGEVTRLERGIDPGWSYNVGKAPLDGLTPPPRLKGDGREDNTSELNSRQVGEIQSALSAGDYARVRDFFAAFGLDSREAAIAGTVWHDAAGWPMVVSTGLLRSADGTMVQLGSAQAAGLAKAAQVLRDPDTIGWIWVTGRDGRAMLLRRFISAAGVVDLGGRFWRWHGGSNAGFRRGKLVWTREEGVLAAFDPRQPRHP
ncbi:MAG: minor capsid protein [Sphingomonadales bacterium]|nr:minor capsid protein [Sphingomonadales bacterium]MBD3772113.1 minor capsid protein [Paracoccaceae bacterium]